MAKLNKHKHCKHALEGMRKFVKVGKTCPHKFEMGKSFVVLKENCEGCSFFERKPQENQKRECTKSGITEYIFAETAWHSFLQKVWAKIKDGEKIKFKTKYSKVITGRVEKKYDSFLLISTKNYKVCINIGELFCGDYKIIP